MPEHPQWSERTLDMPPQDPWADQPTAVDGPSGPASVSPAAPFSQGRASVRPRPARQRFTETEPTGTGWPDAAPPAYPPLSWRGSDLRRGGGWTTLGALFAFVCWGIWAISNGSSLATPVITFLITLAVAAGVFFLARFVGHLVLERWLGRRRRSARGSHLITAVFLAGVGFAELQQVRWIMQAYHWIVSQFS